MCTTSHSIRKWTPKDGAVRVTQVKICMVRQANYFRGERPTGYRFRNITLPAGAAVEKLNAEYKDGGNSSIPLVI